MWSPFFKFLSLAGKFKAVPWLSCQAIRFSSFLKDQGRKVAACILDILTSRTRKQCILLKDVTLGERTYGPDNTIFNATLGDLDATKLQDGTENGWPDRTSAAEVAQQVEVASALDKIRY